MVLRSGARYNATNAINATTDHEAAAKAATINFERQERVATQKHKNDQELLRIKVAGKTVLTAEEHDANILHRRDRAMMCVFFGVLIAFVLVAFFLAMNATKQQIEEKPVGMVLVYSVMNYLRLSDWTQTFLVHMTVNTWIQFFHGPGIIFKIAGTFFVAQFFICCVGPCFETRKQPHRGLFSYPPASLTTIMTVSVLVIRCCAPPIEIAPIPVLCSVEYPSSKLLALDGPLRMEFVTFMNEHYPHHPGRTSQIDFKTVTRGFLSFYMKRLHNAATTETDVVKRAKGAKFWEKLVKSAIPGVDCLGDASTPAQETVHQRHLFDCVTGGWIDGDILFAFVMCCFIIFWYSTWQKKA